jgi:CO/xanthine dehydrogenase Mo-binding subunit
LLAVDLLSGWLFALVIVRLNWLNLCNKNDEVLVNAWVKLLPDNSVTVIVSHAEMGQGAQSALAMMLANEMISHN